MLLQIPSSKIQPKRHPQLILLPLILLKIIRIFIFFHQLQIKGLVVVGLGFCGESQVYESFPVADCFGGGVEYEFIGVGDGFVIFGVEADFQVAGVDFF